MRRNILSSCVIREEKERSSCKYIHKKNNFDTGRRIAMSFIKHKIEEKIGLDLDGDGRIGGEGPAAKIERATHVDLNGDGRIGGHVPSASGGLVGRIEKATHIDLNGDGRIGGGYPVPPRY